MALGWAIACRLALAPGGWQISAVAGCDVRSVTVRPILADEVGRFNAELDAHHWLGHRLTGQVLRYVAVLDGEWVALVGFGSAALSCAARDRFLGWS